MAEGNHTTFDFDSGQDHVHFPPFGAGFTQAGEAIQTDMQGGVAAVGEHSV